MNKKGFTLIELLAVIVILAIIALIATPIVLNIISDSKEEAELRSAEFYLDGLELSIAQATLDGQNITDGTYNILENGNVCLKYDADNKCTEELKVEVKGETPKEGTIEILNGEIVNISVTLNNKEIYKNSKGELVYVKTLEEVCELKEDITPTGISAGDKYECKVDPNKEPYTFYVLTTPKEGDTRLNLIMDQNINSDGTPAGTNGVPKYNYNSGGEENYIYNLVEWINQEDYESVSGQKWFDFIDNNTFGPITAMNFLNEATKTWTNTNELKISKFNSYNDWSGTIIEEYIMSKTYNIYARMPYYSEFGPFGDWGSVDKNKAYLYANLENINGYWILSSTEDSITVWYMGDGYVSQDNLDKYFDYGVRPVISLKI